MSGFLSNEGALELVSNYAVMSDSHLQSVGTTLALAIDMLCSVDKTTVSGKSRAGSKSHKEPDLVLELKCATNKTICELGIEEVTSLAQRNYEKKNAKDLVRVGLALKEAWISFKTCLESMTLFFQDGRSLARQWRSI